MLIAGNWKMFKTPAETEAFCRAFEPPPGVDVVICPPYTSLREAAAGGLTVYAQNVHWAEEGAFTGEISARMLRELGVRGALVGHSERRQYFGEDDQLVSSKGRAVLAAGMRPIVCVGESLRQRESGQTADVVSTQVRGSLAGLLGGEQEVVIAYEPVWAIGTGRTASAADAQETVALCRSVVAELAGKEVADATRVLYGGSVKPGNAAELMAEPDIDGALVGGASLKAEDFVGIVKGTYEQVGGRR
jgi:triosephosphate isomerase (TIM)